MFTIIGGDGQEYGPANAQQIRAWIAAGRANLDTQAKALGSDEWRRLGDFAEFAPIPEAPPTLASSGAPSSPDAPTSVLADRGMRLLSRLIDWVFEIICTLPGVILLWPHLMQLGTTILHGQQPDFTQLDMPQFVFAGGIFGLGWFVSVVTQMLLLSLRSQSLGKLITGLRIERIDGSRPGFVYGWLLREALLTVGGMVLSFLPFLGPVLLRPAWHITDWCLIFRDDRRCLHDLFAGTRVVKK